MDNWLGKVSRHPTGSAIIGGVVVLAVGAAVTKWWDNIVGALGSVWCCPAAIAHRVGGWFSYKVPVPRYALIGGLLLIIGLTYIGCAYLVRSAIKASLRASPTRSPTPGSLDSATLTDEDSAILRFVASHDGAVVSFGDILVKFGWSRLITQRHLERLIAAQFLDQASSTGSGSFLDQMHPADGVVLTRLGVDLAINQGWIPTGSIFD